MFPITLDDVGIGFLDATGRDSISGIHYITLCLLLAQAMEDMIAGYSGSSYRNTKYLSEAIGYQLANPSNNLVLIDRYYVLMNLIYKIQSEIPEFSNIIENFLQKYRYYKK